jgi:hypothetical protein
LVNKHFGCHVLTVNDSATFDMPGAVNPFFTPLVKGDATAAGTIARVLFIGHLDITKLTPESFHAAFFLWGAGSLTAKGNGST